MAPFRESKQKRSRHSFSSKPSTRARYLSRCEVGSDISGGAILAVGFDPPCPRGGRPGGIRLSWVALFIRAYGLTCQAIPELRQLYASYPWARLYEHPYSVGSITIHRDDPRGGKRLIWGRFDNPESKPLLEIQCHLEHSLHHPLEQVFRDGIRMERLPQWMRRFSWWMAMNWQPRQRAKKIGTFSISTLSGEGILNRGHPLVATSSLAYGRCDDRGECPVTLLADHRVLDGVLAAQSLARLEETLSHQVLDEVQRILDSLPKHAA